MLLHLARRHGTQWLSGPRRARSSQGSSQALTEKLESLGFELPDRLRAKLTGLETLEDLFRHYFFRGVVLDSHEGLVGWLEGRYPLIGRRDIPSPREMLDIQCEGRRFVTLLLKPEEQFVAYGRHRDACDFILHDFEHAHKFFADPDSHRGQVRFFRALRATLPELRTWTADARYGQDLDYLMSDMNSHPVHLMKFLKAVVLTAEMRGTEERDPPLTHFWRELFQAWGMSGDELEAALLLNHPGRESEEAQRKVAEFFMRPESPCTLGPRAST